MKTQFIFFIVLSLAFFFLNSSFVKVLVSRRQKNRPFRVSLSFLSTASLSAKFFIMVINSNFSMRKTRKWPIVRFPFIQRLLREGQIADYTSRWSPRSYSSSTKCMRVCARARVRPSCACVYAFFPFPLFFFKMKAVDCKHCNLIHVWLSHSPYTCTTSHHWRFIKQNFPNKGPLPSRTEKSHFAQ